MDTVKYILDIFVESILDCMEDCFESFSIAQGRRVLKVTAVCGILCIVIVAFNIFGWYTFISWYEALVACLITFILSLISGKNEKVINAFKNIKERRKK